MRSNITKYYFFTTLYSLALMFCSGSVIQTFLLQSGFTSQQVYLYNAMIQIVQVVIMIGSIFVLDFIRKTKKIIGVTTIATIFLFLALFFCGANRSGNIALSIGVMFSTSFVVYCFYGVRTIESYRLPYSIMDIKSYGKISALSLAIHGAATLGVSLLYSFVASKYDFFKVHYAFFAIAILFIGIATVICFSFKEQPLNDQMPDKPKKFSDIKIFKNKKMYVLLLPNFLRGVTFGVLSLLTVIGLSENLLTVKTSGLMVVANQLAILLGNFVFAFTCKKFSSRCLMMVSCVCMCIFLPLTIARGNSVDFIVFYCIGQFFCMIVDTAIPVIVTEFVPYDQMGAFTAIRLAVYTFGSAFASVLLDSLIKLMGYLPLLILASVFQFICCISYFFVSKNKDDLGSQEQLGEE